MTDLQSGNPHQLTRNQHIFPVASLRRFCDEQRTLQVVRHDGRRFRCPPENRIFGVQRLWNQQAESGYPREVEDSFQTAASRIIEHGEVDPDDMEAVSNFYALLHLRRYFYENPLETSPIENFLGVSPEYDQNSREFLEANWITTIAPDGNIDSQSMNGMLLTLSLLRNPIRESVSNWGTLEAAPGHEFIVADRLVRDLILPLTPNILLRGNWPSQRLSARRTARYNMRTIAFARDYYFGRHIPK